MTWNRTNETVGDETLSRRYREYSTTLVQCYGSSTATCNFSEATVATQYEYRLPRTATRFWFCHDNLPYLLYSERCQRRSRATHRFVMPSTPSKSRDGEVGKASCTTTFLVRSHEYEDRLKFSRLAALFPAWLATRWPDEPDAKRG